jgi:hypothetical protein
MGIPCEPIELSSRGHRSCPQLARTLGRLGDNTPRIMDDWAQESCRAWLADPRIPGTGKR